MEILFTQLSPVEMTLMASGILCAAAMRAFTGFGFALMAVPLLSLFLLPTDAVVLVALLTLLTSLVTYRAWWGRFGLRDGLPMVGGSVVGTGVGVIFLTQLSLAQFQLWIGLIVIFLSLVLSRYRPQSHVGGPKNSGRHWHFVGFDEWRLCHTRSSGHYLRDGVHTRARK